MVGASMAPWLSTVQIHKRSIIPSSLVVFVSVCSHSPLSPLTSLSRLFRFLHKDHFLVIEDFAVHDPYML
jgi:hypothetical protein